MAAQAVVDALKQVGGGVAVTSDRVLSPVQRPVSTSPVARESGGPVKEHHARKGTSGTDARPVHRQTPAQSLSRAPGSPSLRPSRMAADVAQTRGTGARGAMVRDVRPGVLSTVPSVAAAHQAVLNGLVMTQGKIADTSRPKTPDEIVADAVLRAHKDGGAILARVVTPELATADHALGSILDRWLDGTAASEAEAATPPVAAAAVSSTGRSVTGQKLAENDAYERILSVAERSMAGGHVGTAPGVMRETYVRTGGLVEGADGVAGTVTASSPPTGASGYAVALHGIQESVHCVQEPVKSSGHVVGGHSMQEPTAVHDVYSTTSSLASTEGDQHMSDVMAVVNIDVGRVHVQQPDVSADALQSTASSSHVADVGGVSSDGGVVAATSGDVGAMDHVSYHVATSSPSAAASAQASAGRVCR